MAACPLNSLVVSGFVHFATGVEHSFGQPPSTQPVQVPSLDETPVIPSLNPEPYKLSIVD